MISATRRRSLLAKGKHYFRPSVEPLEHRLCLAAAAVYFAGNVPHAAIIGPFGGSASFSEQVSCGGSHSSSASWGPGAAHSSGAVTSGDCEGSFGFATAFHTLLIDADLGSAYQLSLDISSSKQMTTGGIASVPDPGHVVQGGTVEAGTLAEAPGNPETPGQNVNSSGVWDTWWVLPESGSVLPTVAKSGAYWELQNDSALATQPRIVYPAWSVSPHATASTFVTTENGQPKVVTASASYTFDVTASATSTPAAQTDIVLESVRAPVNNKVPIDYRIDDSPSRPFRMALYASSDDQFDAATDTKLYSHWVIDPRLRTVGSHSIEASVPNFDPANIPSGTRLFVVADDLQSIAETKEDNNIIAIGVDLAVVTASTTDLATIDFSYQVNTVDARLQNLVPDKFRVGIFLSKDDKFDSSDQQLQQFFDVQVPNRAPGQYDTSVKLQAKAQVNEDHRYILVVADPPGVNNSMGAIPEMNEVNNAAFAVPLIALKEQMNRLGDKRLAKTGDETSTNASGEAKGPVCRADLQQAGVRLDTIWKEEPQFGFYDPPRSNATWAQQTLAAPVGELVRLINLDLKRMPSLWGSETKFSINSAHSLNPVHMGPLHKEGRALDIQPVPPSAEGLSRLAGLAWLAGFDWVFEEDQRHVHVSMRADPAIVPQTGLCPPVQITGDLQLQDSLELQVTSAAEHERVNVSGSVKIQSISELNLFKYGNVELHSGEEMVILDNDGGGATGDAIEGTFKDKPEGHNLGSNFLGTGLTAKISYKGGDGNDVSINLTPGSMIPWHSPRTLSNDVRGAESVNPDGSVDGSDVVAIINYINAIGTQDPNSLNLPDDAVIGFPFGFLDTDGDNKILGGDVIKVINYINAGKPDGGEAPQESEPVAMLSAEAESSNADDLFALIAADTASQFGRRRRL